MSEPKIEVEWEPESDWGHSGEPVRRVGDLVQVDGHVIEAEDYRPRGGTPAQWVSGKPKRVHFGRDSFAWEITLEESERAFRAAADIQKQRDSYSRGDTEKGGDPRFGSPRVPLYYGLLGEMAVSGFMRVSFPGFPEPDFSVHYSPNKKGSFKVLGQTVQVRTAASRTRANLVRTDRVSAYAYIFAHIGSRHDSPDYRWGETWEGRSIPCRLQPVAEVVVRGWARAETVRDSSEGRTRANATWRNYEVDPLDLESLGTLATRLRELLSQAPG